MTVDISCNDLSAVCTLEYVIVLVFNSGGTILIVVDKTDDICGKVIVGIMSFIVFVNIDNIGHSIFISQIIAERNHLILGICIDLCFDDLIEILMLGFLPDLFTIHIENDRQSLCNHIPCLVRLQIVRLYDDIPRGNTLGKKRSVSVIYIAALRRYGGIHKLLVVCALLKLLRHHRLEIEQTTCNDRKAYGDQKHHHNNGSRFHFRRISFFCHRLLPFLYTESSLNSALLKSKPVGFLQTGFLCVSILYY